MQLPKYIQAAIVAAALATIGTIYMEKTFLAFLAGWIILLPIIACGYLIYGLIEYRRENKNRIMVSVKPNSITERYAELIRKEEEIRREKEVLYKELVKDNKVGQT